MKLSPDSLRRPERPSQRFEFKDQTNPEAVWAVYLRKLDPTEEASASQRAEDLTRRYIAGGFVDERTGAWSKDPLPFHAVAGEVPELSQALFSVMCRIEMAQKGCPESERYTAEELVGLACCMPEAWEQVRGAFFLIQGGADPKAVLTAFTGPPSEAASDTAPDTPPR